MTFRRVPQRLPSLPCLAAAVLAAPLLALTGLAGPRLALAGLPAPGPFAAPAVQPGSAQGLAPSAPDPSAPEPLELAHACRSDSDQVRITAAFVGDVLMHDTLQIQAAERSASGGFATTWSSLGPALAHADVTYANLEGPVAENLRCDGRLAADAPPVTYANSTCGGGNASSVYTNFPRFNYPPNLLDELSRAGVDVVSTANNHALDRFSLGADMTVAALERSPLSHFGTRRAADRSSFYAITSVAGDGGELRLAWLACTYSTNGIPDLHDQVLHCYTEAGDPNPAVLRTVTSLASRPDVDAVLVTPHWGAEYRSEPVGRQRDLARRLVEAGALAVIGAHPHVVQPMERIEVDGREGLVAYSLGNFVADQPDLASRTGIMLFLGIAGHDGDTWIDAVHYLPFYMAHRPPGTGLMRSLVPLDRSAAPGTTAAGAAALVADLLPSEHQIGASDSLEALVACRRPGPTKRAVEGAGERAAKAGWGTPALPEHWEHTRL